MKKYPTILFFFFAVFVNTAYGQWKKLFDFGSQIQTIYFLEDNNVPQVGFIGTFDRKLWRTSDGGMLWQQISIPSNWRGVFPRPRSFSFKSNTEGWFSPADDPFGYIYRTIDGGLSWSIVNDSGSHSVFYISSTDRLIASHDSHTLAYSLDGVNFTSIDVPGTPITIGIAFSDDLHGIISSGKISPVTSKFLYTSDGGLTWAQSEQQGEQYKPIGIKGTKTFFAISEQDAYFTGQANILIRSDDGGITWRKIYQYHDPQDEKTTGTLQYNSSSLFFQTVEDNSEGIMVSEDSGLTFSSICGPPSYFDTHFYVRDSFIYAGDKNGGLWLNTTGIGVPSALAISASSITFQAFDCNTPDTVITFSLFDSCSGTGGHLIEASLSDSSAFRILSGDTPRVIHLDDSLRISYQPNLSTGSKDVANLLLRFKLGWKEFDTTITLFGIGSNKKETVGFALSRPQSSAKAGNTTDIRISPIRTIANKGLNEITFDLTYNGDVLGMPQASTGGAGLTITQGAETRAGKFATFPVTIKGTNMTLDSGQAFANVQFFVYLSDSTSTPIELSNMHLNQTDPDYERCTLSATTDSTRLQVDLLCGDSIIVEYMRGHHLPLRIVSLKPNPAENEVQVELDAAEGGVTMMEIYDELGKRVMRREINFAKGRQKVTISTADLPEGMYSVRLGNVSGRFVKVK